VDAGFINLPNKTSLEAGGCWSNPWATGRLGESLFVANAHIYEFRHTLRHRIQQVQSVGLDYVVILRFFIEIECWIEVQR
jgi:hypothetical protein